MSWQGKDASQAVRAAVKTGMEAEYANVTASF